MEWDNLHELLRSLYDDMMPLAGDMAAVAKGLAGLGALFYVALKVWQALSRAEPIDMFPLLRPFALGLCIMFFPTIVLGTINAVLSPVVVGTHQILEDQVLDLNKLQQQKDQLEYEAMVRNPETAYMVSDEEFDKKLDELGWSPSDIGTMAGMYMDRQAYKIEKAIKDWFRNLLEILFQAAALVIDTIRTFFLIVLSILGPIAFAISVWDGFQSTLRNGSRGTSAFTSGCPFRTCLVQCSHAYNPSYSKGIYRCLPTLPIYLIQAIRCTSFL